MEVGGVLVLGMHLGNIGRSERVIPQVGLCRVGFLPAKWLCCESLFSIRCIGCAGSAHVWPKH